MQAERLSLVGRHASGEGSLAELSRQFGVSRKTAYKTLRRYQAYGELGSIVIDHNAGRSRFSDVNGTRWLQADEKRVDRFVREIAHFLDCVQGKAEPIMTGVDGVEGMRIMQAAVKSARDGKRVILRG